jgi:uncharacterized membrane protein YgaE (UPF0421/DUF939 family)
MRKRIVKTGSNLLLAGVVSLILATFYHGHVARLLLLSPGGETVFIFLGFLVGTGAGSLGILLALAGVVLAPRKEQEVRLSYTLILLASAIVIYLFLSYLSLTGTEQPRLEPCETITI